MRLAYIDESYNTDSYWFGAVLVPENADADLQREILAIPGRYAGLGVPHDAEIHGYPLWNGLDEWDRLEPRLREDAMRRTLRTVKRAEADVVFVGIDRRSDPRLSHLNTARAFAVDELLDCIEKQCSDHLSERCLLIFDEETSTSRQLFDVVHRHHRKRLAAGNNPMIVERPVIAPSHTTPGVQLADVAVYLRQREHLLDKESDDRAHASRERLMGLIRPFVRCDQAP